MVIDVYGQSDNTLFVERVYITGSTIVGTERLNMMNIPAKLLTTMVSIINIKNDIMNARLNSIITTVRTLSCLSF